MSGTSSATRRRDAWTAAALILPALGMIGLFILLPLFYSLAVSLTNFSLTRPAWNWVGLYNYQRLLWGDGGDAGTFRVALLHSFYFSVLSVTLELAVGFGLALLLNRVVHFGGILRTLLVLPIMVAPTVSALQWRWILDPDNGIFNFIALRLGLLAAPQLWLIQPSAAMWAVIWVDVWQTAPFVMLFLLAGLQSLPAEPLEAARVDGASSPQIFWFLTLPLLRPVILSVLLLRFMDAFRIFDIVYVLTRGGPAFATDMVSLFTYRTGLQWFEIGSASAAGLLALAVIALCAATLLSLSGVQREKGGA